MAKIIPMDFIKSITGKVCQHSDSYFSANKSSGVIHTGKICNPYTGEASSAQLAAQEAFTTKAGYVNTWLNANKPSTSNPSGTANYQLALSLKKQLGLASVRSVVYKYMNTSGVVTLPGASSDSTTNYTVVLTASPSGAGTLTGGGSVAAGGSVTIKAVPATGYTFVKWSDNNTSAERVITVNSDLSLTAIFSGSGPEE